MQIKGMSIGKLLPLSIQHVFAMFGATVLVPLLTGLHPATALFTSATGTIIFHLVTGGRIPAYLGSSFAFIAPIILVSGEHGFSAATGACIIAGLIYLLTSVLVKAVGIKAIQRFIPPVVVGPVIMTIGLGLAPVAKDMAEGNLFIAGFTLAVVIAVSLFAKGMFKLIPILIGIVSGYLMTLLLQMESVANSLGALANRLMPEALIDFSPVADAGWLAMPRFVAEADYLQSGGVEFLLPSFVPAAILLIAPIAIVTMVEHLGDMLAISKTVEKDYLVKPGLHRTLLGDGLATTWAGFLGGPPNTTYGENIGVLAITRVHNPVVVQGAALFVLLFSLSPKVGSLLATIPEPVMGGIVILLFGMIASVGIRTLIEKQVDLSKVRNLVIVSTIIILGISGIAVLGIAGMGLGAIIGIFLNIILPDRDEDKTPNPLHE
ncbi:MAG: uracil permease [Firmicutes bacterium]|nr:uracil permease [Bacillota bacterium]